MAIHWQVKFKSLRTDTLYTVNVYDDDYSGDPVQLTGAAQPFVTQEDDDDDWFTPIRTQSGYLRIVDTGKDNEGNAFDWRDLIPATDTSRPVTLTDADNEVMWKGFIQAQNFGTRTFEMPQEREFPLQCPLSILSCKIVSAAPGAFRNFAYLLKAITNTIPADCQPDSIVIQGGSDAQQWLLKMTDWQNMTTLNKTTLEGRFNMFELLEEVCRYWGWTARTHGSSLFLVCPDDMDEQSFLTLTPEQLATMAAGDSAGTVTSGFSSVVFGNDIFASVNQNDYQLRGYNKAVVHPDINRADEYVDPFTTELERKMDSHTWNDGYSDWNVHAHYTPDESDTYTAYIYAHAFSGLASFNFAVATTNNENEDIGNVIRFKKTYTGNNFVIIQTNFDHDYSNGFFRIYGTTYRDGVKWEDRTGGFYMGNCDMWARFGIGSKYTDALWWDGEKWVNSMTEFRITIGNINDLMYSRYWPDMAISNAKNTSVINTPSALHGRIFFYLLGSNYPSMPTFNNEKTFDIQGFRLQFEKNSTVTKSSMPNSGYVIVKDLEIDEDYKYEAGQQNTLAKEYSVDTVFATSGIMHPAYGVLLNQNGTPFTGYDYGSTGTLVAPEQHLANRIITYWNNSRRKMELELLADRIDFTPRMKGVFLGTTVYPAIISHDWREDVINVVLMDCDTQI